ncbi:MAG: polysaccharide lyase family 8 super-sandwich domain-containing protein [Verrucomicrobiota bacterium]
MRPHPALPNRSSSPLIGKLLLLFVLAALLPSAHADEYDTLRLKWRDLLTGGTNFTADSEITTKVNSLNSSGNTQWNNMVKTGGLNRAYLWSDLASTNNSSHVTTSFSRLLTMATAWATKGAALENNTNLVNDIVGALDWMYAKRYHTNYPSNTPYDNWWDWEVGAPQALNDVVVIVYSKLTSTQINQLMNAVDFFTPAPAYTAANRTYTARVVALRGVIGKSSSKLTSTRDGLDIVFPYTWAEGFHKDGSFLQHGAFPYTGGYGDAQLNDLGRIMYLLNGSTWAITNSQRTNVYNWVYEAYEPVLYKGACMDMQRGRSLSRSGEDHSTGHSIIHSIIRLTLFAPTNHATAYKQMAKYWIQTDTYRNVVTQAPSLNQLLLAKAIRDDASITPKSELVVHRTFPEMDRVVHRRTGWGAGLAMFSDRIYNYESINGENLKGWHTSDGMLYLYNTDLGHFAGGFWPTVNPKRLPGTTVDTLALANGAYEGLYSTKNHVGGANILGSYGVAAMDYASVFSSLTARKSWFLFDDEIVALGSDITSTDNRIIETTIENRKLNASGNNAFTVNGAAQSTTLGWSATLNNVTSAHLAGSVSGADIGYYFPTATTLKAVREQRTNSWANIGGTSTSILTNRFLTLWRDHGSNPSNASYAYVLLPNKTSAQVSSYAASPNITVLANTSSAHAVKENTLNIVAANFWTDTATTVDLITSDRKAAVLTKENSSDLEVAVSDPTQQNSGNASLAPAADSYVWGGSTNSNYGTATSLVTKDASGEAYDRWAYLKFDLSQSSFTGINAATLNLTVASLPNGTTSVSVYQVTNDSWTESGITWANRPSLGALIASASVTSEGQVVSVNVASYVNGQFSGDKVVGLAVVPTTADGRWVSFGSRESSTKPRLDLVGTFDAVLTADADTYIWDGSPDSNYGTATSLVVKDATAGYDRWSFFKFDVAATATATSSVTSATLKLSVASLPDGASSVSLYTVTSDAWTETGLTWANRPSLGSLISSASVTAVDQVIELDATSFVNGQLTGDKTVSLAVVATTADAKWISFRSRETSIKPVLALSGIPGGYINLELARSASSTISADSRVTVHRLTPTIRLSVNVNSYPPDSDANNGIRGNTWRAKFTLDTTQPTVSITAPANNAYLSGSSVAVNASASDNVGVVGVQFKLDGANLGAEVTASPYGVTWDTTGASNGSHTLTAVARDAAGNTKTSSVVNVTVDNAAPTGVSVTAPAAGARIGGTVTVSGAASDNIGVAGVQFKLDGNNLGAEDTTSPYSISWNTTTAGEGSHTLTAVARDAAGNTTTSAGVSVTVDNTGPTVSVTAPTAGAHIRGQGVTISATASDGAGVAGVQFKVDGANANPEDTTSPYSITWNSTTVGDGAHTITAVARDTLNNSTTSAGVNVTVDNTSPTVTLTAPLDGQTVNGFLTLLTATASDANNIAGVQFKHNGANIGAEDTSSPYQVAWNTLSLANGTNNQLTAVARDPAGNLTTSVVAQVTVANTLLQANGGAGWVNSSVDSQQQAFEFEFDASPSLNPMDGVMGLAKGAAGNYTNLACIVRFNTSGFIDARNGSVYAAVNSIPYTAGANYHFRFVVNVPAHIYSAYVTPEGGSEQLIGANYAFRTEQASVSVLNNIGLITATTNATLLVWNPLALDSALVSWHRLDETFGLTAFDSTKNNYLGTVLGGAAWTSGGLGGAIDLDGVNDAVQVPANQWNFTNGLTLSTWLYSVTPKSWESFINFGNGNGNNNIMLYRDGTNANVKFAIYNGTNLSAILVSNVLVLNQWQQLTVTVNTNGSTSVFTNGVLAKTQTINVVPTVLRTNNFYGRASGGGSYHDGAIDDVRIYTRPMSTNEVFLLP